MAGEGSPSAAATVGSGAGGGTLAARLAVQVGDAADASAQLDAVGGADGAAAGAEDEFPHLCRGIGVGLVDPGLDLALQAGDLAEFVLNQVEQPGFLRQGPFLSSP